MGGKGSSGKAKPKFKSYAEARKDREKFRKKLVNCHCDAYVDAVDVNAVDKFKISASVKNYWEKFRKKLVDCHYDAECYCGQR